MAQPSFITNPRVCKRPSRMGNIHIKPSLTGSVTAGQLARLRRIDAETGMQDRPAS